MSKYSELKEKYKGKRIILHVASYLSPMKGTDYAIEAMGYVNKEFPDVLLLIINSHNEFERQGELLSLAHDCGAKIQFVTMVKDEDMPAYYSLAEVLLAPSLDENVHLPQLEAQSCECAILKFGGRMEDEEKAPLVGGIVGLTSCSDSDKQTRDSGALGRALCMILNTDRGKRIELGKNARQFILDNFTWEKNIESYKRIIKEVANV